MHAGHSSPCHKGAEPTILGSYDDLVEMTVNKSCKYSIAFGSTVLDAVVGRHCGKLLQTGQPFFEGSVSFVLPRGSPWTDKLSNATLQLKVEGALPSLQEYFENKDKCTLQNDPTLTFQKLRIFFFVSYAVCFLIFLEMVIDPQSVRKEPEVGVAEAKRAGAESPEDGSYGELGTSSEISEPNLSAKGSV